jgi:hypothetical protein
VSSSQGTLVIMLISTADWMLPAGRRRGCRR